MREKTIVTWCLIFICGIKVTAGCTRQHLIIRRWQPLPPIILNEGDQLRGIDRCWNRPDGMPCELPGCIEKGHQPYEGEVLCEELFCYKGFCMDNHMQSRYDAAEEKKVPTTKKPKSKIPNSDREGGLQEYEEYYDMRSGMEAKDKQMSRDEQVALEANGTLKNPGPVEELESADMNSTKNAIEKKISVSNDTNYDIIDEDGENEDLNNFENMQMVEDEKDAFEDSGNMKLQDNRINQEDPIYDGPEGYDQYPAYPGENQYGDYSGDAYPQYYGPAYDDYHADYEEYPYDYYGDAYGDYYGPAYYDYNEAYGNNYESGDYGTYGGQQNSEDESYPYKEYGNPEDYSNVAAYPDYQQPLYPANGDSYDDYYGDGYYNEAPDYGIDDDAYNEIDDSVPV